MGNAQQGDALPGTVGIFQPIAGLGAEKPGFRVPAPAAVGGMENTVVRNEVGQLPLAEHRKVEAIAPRQIPRGVFRCKGNAPLGKHPGDFLVAAGGDAAAAPGSARHQGVLADQFLLAALAPAPPENATPCPPLPAVLQYGAFSKPLALQVPYPILMGTPAAAGVPTFQFMGVHLHHFAAVALTVPKGARPRLGPAPQGAHHQLPKPLPGEVVALGCLGLVPGLGHLPAKTATALGDPPAQAGAPGGDPSPALAGAAVPGFPACHAGRRRHLFHHRQPAKGLSHHGNSGPGHSVSPLLHGQTPVPVKQTQGPAYATKNPGISWDTRDSRIFNMVTRRGFEPRTPCLKGRCSAN